MGGWSFTPTLAQVPADTVLRNGTRDDAGVWYGGRERGRKANGGSCYGVLGYFGDFGMAVSSLFCCRQGMWLCLFFFVREHGKTYTQEESGRNTIKKQGPVIQVR